MSDNATPTPSPTLTLVRPTVPAPTIEELLAMDDYTFRQRVTDDMYLVRQHGGPFQSREVIQRTMQALTDSLWQTNSLIDERAEDPKCPAELYAKTVRYRSHLLSVIEATDRRIGFYMGSKERDVRRWKAILHSVIDAILAGKDDSEILDIEVPGYGDTGGLTLEIWHEIRCAKDPSRVTAALEAA